MHTVVFCTCWFPFWIKRWTIGPYWERVGGLEDVGDFVALEVPGSSPVIVLLLPGEKHLAFMQHTMGGVSVRDGR